MQALFKARFEQALESQKLNIKKIEQQLRRMGVNPEDPVAMASIQRVAATFFNAIDKKEGSPYVFRDEKQPLMEPNDNLEHLEPAADSDQEQLDRFIADIENAADEEWAAEEAAEKEEVGKIRYWNREDFGGRIRRSEMHRSEDSDGKVRGARHWKDVHDKRWSADRDHDNDASEGDNEWDYNDVGDDSDLEGDGDDSYEAHSNRSRSGGVRRKQDGIGREYNNQGFKRNTKAKFKQKRAEDDSESEDMLSDLDNAMWESNAEEEHQSRALRGEASHSFMSSSDEEEDIYPMKRNEMSGVNDIESNADDNDEAHDHLNVSTSVKQKQDRIGLFRRNAEANSRRKMSQEDSSSDDIFSKSEASMWKSDTEEGVRAGSEVKYNYGSSCENDHYYLKQDEMHEVNHKMVKTPEEMDETWDSD